MNTLIISARIHHFHDIDLTTGSPRTMVVSVGIIHTADHIPSLAAMARISTPVLEIELINRTHTR